MGEPRSRRLRVAPDLSLDFVERGHGPAILLLHGLGDSWRSFRPILPLLPEDVRTLVPTQRGHGDSDLPESDYSIGRFAADAVAFLDAMDVASAVVVGRSMGLLARPLRRCCANWERPQRFTDDLVTFAFGAAAATAGAVAPASAPSA